MYINSIKKSINTFMLAGFFKSVAIRWIYDSFVSK